MKEKKKIGVIFGGCSSEHEVSLKSAYSIIVHINREKYQPVLLGITKDGKWYLYQGAPERIQDGSWQTDKRCVPAVISPDRAASGVIFMEKGCLKTVHLDAALPVLHGRAGEDGTVQGLLELAGIPVIGCGTMASALCMDKDMSHRLVASADIRVPASFALTRSDEEDSALSWARKNGYPVFVKPAAEGSSIGISKVYREEELALALRTAFQYDTKVILEEAIDGFEVGCAILGYEDPIIGDVDEIQAKDGFFDFKEKYTQEQSRVYVPARIPKETARRVRDTAKRIYQLLGCKGFARVDLFLTEGGELVFNEVNTIPGFTVHSRYPNMLKSSGLSYEEIVEKLIETEVSA